MSTAALVNEFAKMRHLRIGLITVVMALTVLGLTVAGAASSPSFAEPAGRTWEALLSSLSLAVPVASPLLLAVLASRQVDIEHQSSGWLLSQTTGISAGVLCRAKFAALATIVAAATLLQSTLVIAAGMLLDITDPVPAGLWVGYTASILVANLVILAFHLLFSAWVDNQLISLGIGVIGTMIAVFASGMPAWLAHTTPWGYYALVAAADYRDGAIIALTPSYPSIAALGLAGAVLFLLITKLFDSQEA